MAEVWDIIIIGAGPAGLTAAVYGQRAGRKTLLLEANMYGGQIINTPEIENYPGIKKTSGAEFAQELYEQATDLGAQLIMEKAVSVEEDGEIKHVHTEQNTYDAKTVIIATGAKNRPLGLPREEELIGAGVSYCATCDGMFFRGKEVAVNGGGNTALGDALFLAQICSKVYLIHRRDQFRGDHRDVEKLKSLDNVEFVLNSNVTGLIGEPKLEAVEVTDVNSGEKRSIPVSALFVAIGQMPENQEFSNVVKLDPKGYVEAGEDCLTGHEGIFTAGDCRTKGVRQLTTAAADGAVAALAASSEIDD